MQSVPEFIQGISSTDPTHDVTRNFGKMMVMYRMLGGHSDIKVSSSQDEDGKTVFDVKSRTQGEASDINNHINGVSYSVYGHTYEVSSSQNKKVVRINIVKKGNS